MADGDLQVLPEQKIDGKRLGRHIHHDERSRRFAAPVANIQPRTKVWRRHGGVLDQGDLGSCTGNAMTGLLMTEPNWLSPHRYAQATAVRIYKKATVLDDFDGTYLPD